MATIDYFTGADIAQDIHRIEAIYATKILTPSNKENPLVKSAFTELIICLRDLMAKTEKYGARITFTDDIPVTSKIPDITELIAFVRNAMCHIESSYHFLVPDKIKASFNIIYGKGSDAPFKPVSDIELISEYTDDTCFFFGLHKIYLRRHILRAFEEAKKQLVPLLQPYDGVRSSWKM